MPCLITSGYSLQCRDNIGGVQNVYIGTFNGSSLTYTVSGTNSQITAFGGATTSFYTFNQPLETASFEQAGNYSTENGTSFYTQTVNITLQKLTSTSASLVNALGQGTWRVIVLDQNGIYWLIGAQNGARVSAATPNTGKALGDLNGTVITFEAKEAITAYQVTSAAALALIV